MSPWLLRRTVEAVATAVLAGVVLVLLLHLLPGDPLAAVLGDHPATPAVEAALRRHWGSLAAIFGGLARGNLGVSIVEQRPVTTILAERLGPTLLLGGFTLLIDFTVGLALGVWSALHPDTIRARCVGAVTIVGYALPSFVIGMLLVWTFSLQLHWLPAGGIRDVLLAPDAPFAATLWDHVKHLALPLIAMVMATLAVPLRQQRAAALTTAAQPWVLAARARGVSPGWIAWRHCWRPALIPIVTLLGLWLPMLVAGAVFVEVVFQWPGVGLLLAQATQDRDIPVVIGGGLLLIVMVQLGSLVADVLYHVVDPAQRRR
ncbi:MAG: ABC transporter permease [Gemmatimonadales bacterium]